MDDRSIIAFLANNYPTRMGTVALWERAGGRAADVPMAETPTEMWHHLWRRSRSGASARPASILREALLEYPNNDILIEGLRSIVAPTALHAATEVVLRLETGEIAYEPPDIAELLSAIPVATSEDAFVVLAPALQSRLPENKRANLLQTLKFIATATGNAAMHVYSETVKAAAEGAISALLATTPSST